MVTSDSHHNAQSIDRGLIADRAAELFDAGASHEAALLAALRGSPAG
jgi:hypothetical protein